MIKIRDFDLLITDKDVAHVSGELLVKTDDQTAYYGLKTLFFEFIVQNQESWL